MIIFTNIFNPNLLTIKPFCFIDKKSSTLSRKKVKDGSAKSEEVSSGTFPRKAPNRTKSLFDDFAMATESAPLRVGKKFNFEGFETSEGESSTVSRPIKAIKQQTMLEKGSSLPERDINEQRGINRACNSHFVCN